MTNQRLLDVAQISETEQLRLNIYRLLARALAAPADQYFLDILKNLANDPSAVDQSETIDQTELGKAIQELAALAAKTPLEKTQQEYQNLFIGLGRGELLPYGSYYLTGFLNEKPLARLRNDMIPLGIERDPSIKEPEDHAGALMDMMAGIIDGSFSKAQPPIVQKEFFKKHMLSWMPHFFKDLQTATEAEFYRPIGKIGELFLEIEDTAFAM